MIPVSDLYRSQKTRYFRMKENLTIKQAKNFHKAFSLIVFHSCDLKTRHNLID